MFKSGHSIMTGVSIHWWGPISTTGECIIPTRSFIFLCNLETNKSGLWIRKEWLMVNEKTGIRWIDKVPHAHYVHITRASAPATVKPFLILRSTFYWSEANSAIQIIMRSCSHYFSINIASALPHTNILPPVEPWPRGGSVINQRSPFPHWLEERSIGRKMNERRMADAPQRS